ncbi:hypothetical protein ACETIH_11525 [Microvirga arabica]|uniref:Uncharacterized protein n=1 Tax=Microvirga arabica TaxID=1128671 RepID=A0ABV6Y7U7_9HYPH
MNLNIIELSRSNTFSALAPAVDRYVRETYCELLKLPVPQRFYDLLNSYEEQRKSSYSNRGSLTHGTTVQAEPEIVPRGVV